MLKYANDIQINCDICMWKTKSTLCNCHVLEIKGNWKFNINVSIKKTTFIANIKCWLKSTPLCCKDDNNNEH